MSGAQFKFTIVLASAAVVEGAAEVVVNDLTILGDVLLNSSQINSARKKIKHQKEEHIIR